ncbi:hypothetical protein [Mangrovibacterium diazotrophicum]|nr:hypothetical protein [Mangrovibacterium diazotrophicum]
MDRTFTLFELLSMSEEDFSSSVGDDGNAEQYFSPVDILEPQESSLAAIRSFAKAYDTMQVDSIGLVELMLN